MRGTANSYRNAIATIVHPCGSFDESQLALPDVSKNRRITADEAGSGKEVRSQKEEGPYDVQFVHVLISAF
jgi:hypothetical protein